ncbi:MAG: sigma-70 family RNA polymerase sigma factor [Dehalococcoidia bacterium]|nr:sigma-70 family RNA polymerase sigma factor [Dehalococcoidia bacterium]
MTAAAGAHGLDVHETAREAVAGVAARHWARVVASVARTADGDFDVAEDAVQEALEAALVRWPRDGVPSHPDAWVITTARRRVIDRLRRARNLERKVRVLGREASGNAAPAPDASVGADGEAWPDDRLRLVFTCCHPALSLEARIALTLRLVAGLSAAEIARAFLVPEPTLARRLTRAKAKIRNARIPYRVPDAAELPERLEGVMRVVYLVFNEGYMATGGDRLSRPELCAEAIRLAEMLFELMPEPEVAGLLALLVLIDSRRDARADGDGTLIVLEEQDRSLWDRNAIAHGVRLIDEAARAGPPGPYQVQAAIAALHATAASPEAVDWRQILALYDELLRLSPTPIVALNRAAALGMAAGPRAGLEAIDALAGDPRLERYHLHAARADLLRRAGRPEAAEAYRRAIDLCANDGERRYLERRLVEVANQRERT